MYISVNGLSNRLSDMQVFTWETFAHKIISHSTHLHENLSSCHGPISICSTFCPILSKVNIHENASISHLDHSHPSRTDAAGKLFISFLWLSNTFLVHVLHPTVWRSEQFDHFRLKSKHSCMVQFVWVQIHRRLIPLRWITSGTLPWVR